MLKDTLALISFLLATALLVGFVLILVFPALIYKAPDWLLLSKPNDSCALLYEKGKFWAPTQEWVEIKILVRGDFDNLPLARRSPGRSQEVDAPLLAWRGQDNSTEWTIDYPIAPTMWVTVPHSGMPDTLTYDESENRSLRISSSRSKEVPLEIIWNCAQPVVTFALLIELIGIGLALLDITGKVLRFEAFLDTQRNKLERWLFPRWTRPLRTFNLFGGDLDSDKPQDDLPILTIFLTLAYMTIFVTAYSPGAWWLIVLWFIAATLAGAVTDFLLKWISGVLIWLVWQFLDKAPAGTVGGIGFMLVLYGIGTNYLA